jgi:alpha-N-arabinofuranosidase
MTNATRRQFLATTALTPLAALLVPARSSAATDSRIEVLLDERIGRIAPEIHGHFTEHLGAVVYDGIWVGEGSKIPNQGGIRSALVERLRAIKAPVIRWPGGCFADSYDWKDGVGPRGSRPTRTNFWNFDPKAPDGPQKWEPNTFGTNEFIRFCQQAGAQPYLAANLRALTPLDFDRWVEYCNSPSGSTTLATLRGGPPFNVRYWGVGNESWGCGGDFTPEEYSTEFRRFTSWVPGYGVPLAFIGSGPNSGEVEWTRRFFAALAAKDKNLVNRVWGWAVHHYSWNVSQGRTTDWNEGKGDALNFPPEEWYELLREGDRMERLITSHWQALAEHDPQRKVKLVVDEWGAWYKPGTELKPSHQLGQQNTIRDAVLAGLTLDTFYRHADKVSMAAIAQLVNCLQSLFLADGDRFLVTPTYHVFAMHAAHQGGDAVRTLVSAPRVSHQRNGQPASIWGLNGSASVNGRQVVVTAVNPSLADARETEIALRGGTASRATATVLTAPVMNAHNTFEAPETVKPTPLETRVTSDGVTVTIPKMSVVALQVDLA